MHIVPELQILKKNLNATKTSLQKNKGDYSECE